MNIVLLLLLLLVGCEQNNAPDYSPVGTGLSVIGLGIVVAAAIMALLGGKGGRDE